MNLNSVKLNITKNINMDINNNTNMMNANNTIDTINSNNTINANNNPFMKKTIKKTNEHEHEKSDRWANLDICEDDQGNKFMSDNEDDPFRKKNNAFSKNSQPETSRNFRRGETFNHSLQFGETPSFVERNQNFKGGSNFMKFTKKKPPPPPY